MRTIDITTTQNVTIEYELATFRDRLLAFIVDMIILLVTVFIVSMMYAFILRNQGYLNYIQLTIFLFYTLASEIIMDGQTLGKKVLGIKVVKLDGKQAVISDYVIRWAFRMVDIWFSFGSLATILISSSSKGQRLGGMLSNTTVIRVRPSRNLQLSDILHIKSRENYQPKYLEVKRFSEEDMLLIKTAMDRVKKYPNKAHLEALDILTARVSDQLGISKVKTNQLGFLQTVLNDYIVLTR